MKRALVGACVAALAAAILLPAGLAARGACVATLALAIWYAHQGSTRLGVAALAGAVLVGILAMDPDVSLAALLGAASLAVACWLIASVLLGAAPLDPALKAIALGAAGLAVAASVAARMHPTVSALLKTPFAGAAITLSLCAAAVLVLAATAAHGSARNPDKGDDA